MERQQRVNSRIEQRQQTINALNASRTVNATAGDQFVADSGEFVVQGVEPAQGQPPRAGATNPAAQWAGPSNPHAPPPSTQTQKNMTGSSVQFEEIPATGSTQPSNPPAQVPATGSTQAPPKLYPDVNDPSAAASSARL